MPSRWSPVLKALFSGQAAPPLRLDRELPRTVPLAELEAWLSSHEAAAPKPIRPDNYARIQWAGKPGSLAPRCIVYLHGYSASWREGGPVHQATAARYGANLLLTRLAGHGLEEAEPLLHWDPQQYWEDAKQALVLGQSLGHELILMATSSGAPLALRLAAEHPGLVQGLVLYSPNVAIRNPFAPLLTTRIGLPLARALRRGLYNEWEATEEEARYWYKRQRLEGAVQLQRLLVAAYKDDILARVTQPVFAGVYYGDAKHQDDTISVAASRKAFRRLGTEAPHKVWAEFPLAGRHVIACDLSSREWKEVQAATWEFLETTLGWKAIPKPAVAVE